MWALNTLMSSTKSPGFLRSIAGSAVAAAFFLWVQTLWAPLHGFFGSSFWYLFLSFVTFSAVYRIRAMSKATIQTITTYSAGTITLFLLYRALVNPGAGVFEFCWFAALFALSEGSGALWDIWRSRRAVSQ
jgi:hypothetical protein